MEFSARFERFDEILNQDIHTLGKSSEEFDKLMRICPNGNILYLVIRVFKEDFSAPIVNASYDKLNDKEVRTGVEANIYYYNTYTEELVNKLKEITFCKVRIGHELQIKNEKTGEVITFERPRFQLLTTSVDPDS